MNMPTTTTASGYRLWLLAAMAGAALMILGSFLPWATVRIAGLSATRLGTDGDGMKTLLMGGVALAALAIALLRGMDRRLVLALSLLALVLGVASALLVVTDVRSVAHRLANPALPVVAARLLRLAERRDIVNVAMGPGVYVTVAGAVLATIASLGALVHTAFARREIAR